MNINIKKNFNKESLNYLEIYKKDNIPQSSRVILGINGWK